jgi:hypothetical protein
MKGICKHYQFGSCLGMSDIYYQSTWILTHGGPTGHPERKPSSKAWKVLQAKFRLLLDCYQKSLLGKFHGEVEMTIEKKASDSENSDYSAFEIQETRRLIWSIL